MTDTRAKAKLTGDDLMKLPGGMGKRYELIEGELITLSPTGGRHGSVVINISGRLLTYNKQHKFGTLFGAETGFYTRGDNKTVRAPDIAFISYRRLPAQEVPDGFIMVAPEIVVEVVSPGDRKSEIADKVREWLNFGVLMVLVAYPKSRRVRVYRSGGAVQILKEDDVLDGGDILPGFSTPVSAFFES